MDTNVEKMETNTENLSIVNYAEKILKLQEKLTSIVNQIHYWKAKSKVFEEKGACNFDSFMKAPSTPSKKPTKSRSLMGRQDWGTLNYTQQYEILHNVAQEYSRVTLNFEALSMAIKASQASEALKRAIGLDNNDSTTEDEIGNVDPDERKYLLELLEEEAEHSEAILRSEDEQLNKRLELINAKCELAKEFSALRDTYSTLLKNIPEDEISHAVPRQKDTGKTSKIDQKNEELKAEEDRVNEIRVLIQKLMMSMPGGCLNYDDETNKRHKSMLIKCGENLPTLRGDVTSK